MTALHSPPAAALSAPGLGWNVDISGHPHAGDATLVNGVPSVPVCFGTVAGRDVVLDSTSLTELDELEYAVHLARARLAMRVQDPANPFGDEAGNP